MSTVMGTMRKMEDSPMDDKMTVAARSTSNGHGSADIRGGCCRRKALVKRRRRPEGRPLNGHHRRTHRRQEEATDSDQGADGDVPMDLSKRAGDGSGVKSRRPEGNGSQDQEAEEQPLNLSRNTRVVALCCNPCPTTPGVSSSASPELLQKRVRLEEMVSCIRRFSVVDNGRQDVSLDAEAEEPRSVFGAVQRSRSCSSPTDAPPAYGRRPCSQNRKRSMTEDAAPGDSYGVDGAPGLGFASYPVLRQQLLGRRAGLDYTKDDGEYKEDEDEEDSSEGDNEDTEDGGALLHHQMRLLSDPAQRFQWSTYAYYASLFQELQGSLASGAPTTLPLSLALPLSMPATENRGESPLSSEGVLMGAATSTAAGAGDAAANAMFRKRAPRALTGKHVKHGTGASPATLLTLRQKIEQKRNQQAASPAHGRMDRKTVDSGRMHKAMKSAPAALLAKKKKAVS